MENLKKYQILEFVLKMYKDEINLGNLAGLCVIINEYFIKISMASEEKIWILDYLNKNTKKEQKKYNRTNIFEYYLWNLYDTKSRIDWLNKHIEILKKADI